MSGYGGNAATEERNGDGKALDEAELEALEADQKMEAKDKSSDR